MMLPYRVPRLPLPQPAPARPPRAWRCRQFMLGRADALGDQITRLDHWLGLTKWWLVVPILAGELMIVTMLGALMLFVVGAFVCDELMSIGSGLGRLHRAVRRWSFKERA